MTRIATNLCLAALLISSISLNAYSADGGDHRASPPKLSSLTMFRLDRLSVGVGGGYNYGGLGSNVLYYLTPQIGIYGGAGTDFRTANYSVGVKVRKITNGSWNVNPYLLATYGFKGRLEVAADPNMTREFPGMAIGIGLDQKLTKRDRGFFTIGVLAPIHGSSYHDYAEYVQQSGYASPKPVIPVRLTFGFRLVIQ